MTDISTAIDAGSGIALPVPQSEAYSGASYGVTTSPQVSGAGLGSLEQESLQNPDAPTVNGVDVPTDTGGLIGSTLSNLTGNNSLDPLANTLDQIAPITGNNTSGAASSSSGLSSTISDLFLRSVVIILGFICVAVGLSMFKTPSATSVVKASKGRLA